MDRLMFALGTLALILVLLGLFAWSWRGRQQRQAGVPRPVPMPDGLEVPRFQALGQYVCTTTAGDWLDRIAVYGLGVKSNATAAVFDEGLLFVRSGAPDLWIPREDLESVRLERGMAGKFVEKEGLVIVTWKLGSTKVDTGFRNRTPEEKTPLVTAITEILPAEPSETSEEQL